MEEKKEQIPQKKKKLTKKERGFVDSYIETENGTKSVLENYNTKKPVVAANIASELLTKPYVQEAIEIKRKTLKQALIDRGIDEDYLAQKVDVLLTATDKEGNDDYTAIDKGMKHALAINGVETEEGRTKTGNIYNIVFSTDAQEKIKSLEEQLKQNLVKQKNV